MNKKELFDYLVKNKKSIIDTKKAETKKAPVIDINYTNHIEKSINYKAIDDLENGIIKRAIVANTYNWLDSHGDVHIDGVFTKSINERKQSVMHLHDHLYQLTAKVGEFDDIIEQKINWTDLSVAKAGYTTSLIGISNIMKEYNALIYNQYLQGKITQHSVSMQYVKIALAVNDPEYKEEFATWSTYAPRIGNIEKALEIGYFWAVTEAKLIEISAVIAGSNELTPTIEPQKYEPLDTHINEPIGIDYKFLKSNLKLF